MGAILDSAGGFLGLSDGPQAPKGNFSNAALGQLQGQDLLYGQKSPMNELSQYAQGQETGNDALAHALAGLDTQQNTEFTNALASGPITGSKFATEQVQGNPLLSGLYGQGGQLNQAEDKLSDLNKQGFELKPEDRTLYGQLSGDIARQYGQQGNQMASDLASRGLSSSGAAGASFSGLAGNKNEQLANAQQQIAQQRFQNTMGQIGQYQSFVNNMGAGANNAINQQYNRQLSGAQSQRQGLAQTAGLNASGNNAENAYGMEAEKFNVDHKPENFMDQSIANSNTASNSFAKGLGSFGAGAL